MAEIPHNPTRLPNCHTHCHQWVRPLSLPLAASLQFIKLLSLFTSLYDYLSPIFFSLFSQSSPINTHLLPHGVLCSLFNQQTQPINTQPLFSGHNHQSTQASQMHIQFTNNQEHKLFYGFTTANTQAIAQATLSPQALN